MTLRQFFFGRTIVLSILLLLGLSCLAYQTYLSGGEDTESLHSGTEEPVRTEVRSFAWRFEEGDALNLDGIPETDVFLDLSYADGTMQGVLIDTVPGGCGILPESDADSVPGTSDIQCYYAGLGHRYKIAEGKDSYLVLRKTFEEASPEYDPPSYEYEAVKEISRSR